tara:strand:+ start:5533 stop:6231 length:699 start_codon:yes stop_codon:yes gene_type:complete
MGWFSPPDPIDPQKVYGFYNPEDETTDLDRLRQRSADMVDPDSPLMMAQKRSMEASAQDQLAASNRAMRQQMASTGLGGQSGIVNQLSMQNDQNIMGNVQKAYQEMLANNIGQSNQLLGQATDYDQKARDAMASAYGQNITNKNNYNASMAGNVFGLVSEYVACDARLKENIKKVGVTKMKNGETTPIYEYNYKGRKKTHVGVIAQDLIKTNPEAVKKGKNGLLYVKLGDIF